MNSPQFAIFEGKSDATLYIHLPLEKGDASLNIYYPLLAGNKGKRRTAVRLIVEHFQLVVIGGLA